MTPLPTPDEINLRWILDLTPGTVTIAEIVCRLKDGDGAKDRPTAYVQGLVLFAKEARIINTWEGQLLQLPFVRGMKCRKEYPNFGRGFFGPDGKILEIGGRVLGGSENMADHEVSGLSVKGVLEHQGYQAWHKMHFEANGKPSIYVRINTNNNIKACDNFVSGLPYSPGTLAINPAFYIHSAAACVPRRTPKETKKTKAVVDEICCEEEGCGDEACGEVIDLEGGEAIGDEGGPRRSWRYWLGIIFALTVVAALVVLFVRLGSKGNWLWKDSQ